MKRESNLQSTLPAVNKTNSPAVQEDTFMASVIEQFVKETDVSPLTQKNYRAGLNVFTGWLESTGGGELTEDRLIEYREWLKKSRATGTAKKYFDLTKLFVGWLSKRGYLTRNVGYGVKSVNLDSNQHSRDALEVSEIATCLAQFDTTKVKGKRDKAIFALLACCGLRTIEVARLNVDSIERRRGQWAMKIWGKGRDGAVDTVILPVEVKTLIDEYLKARGNVQVKPDDIGEPLFISTSNENSGERLQTQTISRLCKKTFRAVGIDDKRIVAHSLRHSNATIALDADVELEDVSMNLRHKNQGTTEIYRHDLKALRNPTNHVVARIIFEAFEEFLKEDRNNVRTENQNRQRAIAS